LIKAIADRMLAFTLLFVACFFAGSIVQSQGSAKPANWGWLVFAVGFFLLALDQQFRPQMSATA
jgi:hypothetical protein